MKLENQNTAQKNVLIKLKMQVNDFIKNNSKSIFEIIFLHILKLNTIAIKML